MINRYAANNVTFAIAYIIGIIPTYMLPYMKAKYAFGDALFGGYSGAIAAIMAAHFMLITFLIVVAWIRGGVIEKRWLIIFPVLAGVFEFVPVLNLIPLIPTGMHLAAIIIGVSSPVTKSESAAPVKSQIEPTLDSIPTTDAITIDPVENFHPDKAGAASLPAREPTGHSTQLPKGLKIGLLVGVPVAIAVVLILKGTDLTQPSTTQAPQAAIALAPQMEKPPASQGATRNVASSARDVPSSLVGLAEVLDTGTLSLNGQRLPLAGLRAVEIPQAATAARSYLAQTGEVKCDSVPVGGWRCVSVAKGLDIAEVFALSGFAKAASNAPDFIRNAEGMARESRRGVWGAS